MFKSSTTCRRSAQVPSRHGMVLLIVLVVVMLLSLGAYTFSEFMLIETKATVLSSQSIQARALADSGVEFVATMLGDRASLPGVGLYHNPGIFQGHLLIDSSRAGGRGRFTVIAPVEGDLPAKFVRYGLIDESSKLNLNTIAALVPADSSASTGGTGGGGTGAGGGSGGSGSGSSGSSGSGSSGSGTGSSDTGETLANPLMGIPGMTLEISEAIFDWIDEDDDQRDNGAENEYYQSLTPPYECKNAKLETLDELLLIRGVTPMMLFGEDANRNGLLDPNENDGALSAPFDNADGFLDRGWSAYLTVYSRELNLQTDRTLRIDVNSNTLSDVYDKLQDALDEDKAKFIVAYRINGAMPANTSASSGGTQASGGNSGATIRQIGGNSGGGGGGRSSSGSGGGGSSRGSSGGGGGGASVQQLSDLARNAGAAMAGSGQVTRGGMDLTNGGKVKINSAYDLIGIQVRATINGASTVLDSPWPNDPGAMESYLPDLIDKLSLNGTDQYIEGRINVNQAHKEVLLGLPNMTEDIAMKIVNNQLKGSNGEPLPEADNSRSTTMWLLKQEILDIDTLRALEPYITGRGDVFRMQVMGHFDGGGPVARVEAIIDATQNPPQPIFFRDLTDLGRGYSLPVLTK